MRLSEELILLLGRKGGFPAPTGILPTGFITDTTPDISWSPVAGASTYTVRVLDKNGTEVYLNATATSPVTVGPALNPLNAPFTTQVNANPGGVVGTATFDYTIVTKLLTQSPLGLWDASTGVYSDAGTTPAANGASVQQWNDQSGNGHHVSQATAGDRPVFRSSVASLNNHPGVEFVSSDYLVRTVTDSILANLNAFNNYVVFRTTSSATGTFYNESDNTFTTRFFVNRINLSFTGAPRCAHSDNASVSLDLNPGTALGGNDGAAHLITWRRIASNSWSLRLDGVQVATATTVTGATTVNRIAIGALVRTTLSQFFVGHIALVANYGSDNYATIEPIIAAHYGIALP